MTLALLFHPSVLTVPLYAVVIGVILAYVAIFAILAFKK